jgi:hypothetical protein
MEPKRRLKTIPFLVVFLCAAIDTSLSSQPMEAKFPDVLAAPARFANQVVTLIGVLQAQEGRFVLFTCEASAEAENFKEAINLIGDQKLSESEKLNRYWVRVTGTVELTDRSEAEDGFNCNLRVHSIEGVRHATRKLWLRDIGTFRNVSGRWIKIKLVDDSGWHMSELGPNEDFATRIVESEAIVTAENGRELFRAKIHVPKRTGDIGEADTREFEFLVGTDKIILVDNPH